MRRMGAANKTPLAIAGILATPLFFVALMAFSLLLEKPSVEVGGGTIVLGDPVRANNAAIYLCSFGVSALVVLLGVAALFLPARVTVFLPALGAIVVTIALLVPLDTWHAEHAARFPDGVDLIPQDDPSDLTLQGEWEQAAHQTANQIGFWTIMLAIAAMAITVALDIRRGRKNAPPPVLPPPEAITAESKVIRRGFGLPRRRSRDT